MDIQVRPASGADVVRLFEIRTAVVQNHLSLEQLQALGITPASLAEAIAAAPCAWVAQVQGRVEAFSMVDLDEGELFALFVEPRFEGLGLGRLLLAEAERALFRRHPRIGLVTDAAPHVRANGFYQRHGWRVVELLASGDCRYEKLAPTR